jgi:hypothetical protein
MNMNATSQMVTVSQGGKPRETELPTEIHVKIDPSLLPKPATGEWTEARVAEYESAPNCCQRLAADINAAIAQVTKERDNATGNCMSLSQLLFADRLLLAQVKELATHNITGCGTCHTIRKMMEDYGRRRLAEREPG